MKPRLTDYAENRYSQFGEDGCVAEIFRRIGVTHEVCVEFGAADGLSCSNTARLWHDEGWTGFLVEPDADRFEQLEGNAARYNTICRRAFVQPGGAYSIAALLAEHDITDVDYMTIDVDGDDYAIFESLAVRPRVVSVEFNPTVPPHVELRQERPGGMFGASLLAVARLGERIGYRFIGATYCNAFFVTHAEVEPFADLEIDIEVLFAATQYTYAATDFAGRVVLCGEALPWGSREPLVLPLEGGNVMPVTDNPQHLRRGFESLWGTAVWLPQTWANIGDPDSAAPQLLTRILVEDEPGLVCLDLSGLSDLDAADWVAVVAENAGYTVVRAGRVLGLIRSAA